MGVRPWEHELLTVEQMDDALDYVEQMIKTRSGG